MAQCAVEDHVIPRLLAFLVRPGAGSLNRGQQAIAKESNGRYWQGTLNEQHQNIVDALDYLQLEIHETIIVNTLPYE